MQVLESNLFNIYKFEAFGTEGKNKESDKITLVSGTNFIT